jgi:FAD/FMN-containing dehydrogenase
VLSKSYVLLWSYVLLKIMSADLAVATGLCECTSVAGPLLGGGHGFLQGQYGYVLDNIVSARVVTASGELVEVAAAKNSDLFWALRGAGHNFGIMTSFEMKTYDIPGNWTVYSIVFASEKTEALFDLVNKFEEPSSNRPAKLALTAAVLKVPQIDHINVSQFIKCSYCSH